MAVRRTFAFALICITASALVMFSSSVAGADGAPGFGLSSGSVDPGGSVGVTGAGCPAGGRVMVGVLDASRTSEIASAVTTGLGPEVWTVSLSIPASTRPGVYAVTARCTSGYNGYKGYNGTSGYNGYNGGGFSYDEGSLLVLAPPTPPAANGPLGLAPNVVRPGDSFVATGSGFAANEQIRVFVYSTPVDITPGAGITTAADGTFSAELVMPAGTEIREHVVVAFNAQSAVNPPRVLSSKITVVNSTVLGVTSTKAQAAPVAKTASSLPMTGSNPVFLILAGVGLLGLGGVVLFGRRRRIKA